MTATGLSTVSAFDAHDTLRLYTSLTAKGKAKKSINFQISSIHKENPAVYDVLACTCIGRSQAFIAQTGLVSLRRKYKDMSSHKDPKNILSCLSFHILLNSGHDFY